MQKSSKARSWKRGGAEDDEPVWLTDKERARLWAEEADIAALEAEQAEDGEVSAIVKSDDVGAQAMHLAKLKESLASLRGLGVPAAANLVGQQIVQIEKYTMCWSCGAGLGQGEASSFYEEGP